MNEINEALFLMINASEHPNPMWWRAPHFLARYVIWLVPLVLFAGWQ